MKATFESVANMADTSFTIRHFEEEYFSAPYHHHPEFELTFIIKGYGKRYVGTRMDDYNKDDLVLLGKNLPHCWKTEQVVNGEINASSIVIQFKEDFLGTNFFDIPEMKAVSRLLDLSKNGLQFTGRGVQEVYHLMLDLLDEQSPVKRVCLFLTILNKLAFWEDFVVLEKGNPYDSMAVVEREKINRVTAYIVEHFTQKVSVDEVAALVHMTPHAFCKYFKRITRKTLMEMVIDYRIDLAARQLVYTDLPVAQIALESGFNDVSSFYKTFRKRKKISPLTYRNRFLQVNEKAN
ncbi:AraC family transcriptional regulator [Olivibacter sp. SDN3]|uniref:AraC family transcriptional regulator n=1 Tax=Olivibacter sp. SDN3 TaxID=2764720 RepID=UPI001651AB4B|nr:AraC family transcriptional regulator [Olivibacter sp. SDN3]QNL49202.1 AraC family transcriptional regulator [Olivibacter sp. SDN3]